MRPQTFVQLSKLTHLTELRLDRVAMDLDKFEQVRLVPHHTLRVLCLSYFFLESAEPLGATFCRIFSTLFPNLEELPVEFLIFDFFSEYSSDPFGVEEHLGLFSKLRKHKIWKL